MANTYRAVTLAKRPDPGPLRPDTFKICAMPLPSVGMGQVLVKQTHLSLDPAVRGFLSPAEDSYPPPVARGEVIRSSGLGEVVESNHSDFKPGGRVMGLMGWTE